MKKRSRLTRRRPTKSQAEIDRIGDLLARVAKLEERIAALEERRSDLWTQIPWKPVLDSSDDARCRVCQNRFKDMTHYVCDHPQCPNGGITCASAPANRWPHLDNMGRTNG